MTPLSKWLLATLVLLGGVLDSTTSAARQPNIVLIMTDNQGAWSLGCYGNPDIQTPNIDGLARSGIRFTRCFSSNAVCSPTRATWLTGLMPSQHGVHCYIHPSRQIGPRAFSTIQEFQSLGTVLARAGYTCGLSGKWHLGLNMKPQCGFTFWVTKPGGSTSNFYDQQVIENGRITKVPGYITDYWTRRGIEFIRANRARPFFLFLAYNGPYGLSNLLLRPARNRYGAEYANQPMRSFPRRTRHPWLYNNRDYLNNVVSMRRYAAEISGIDDGVGQVMAELERLKIRDNTLVIFTADQGLSGGQGGIWGMGDHTRPLSAFDSTMHVPLIFSWPGQVKAKKQCDLLVSNYDLFPSLLNFLGLAAQIPAHPKRPGRSYAPVLRGTDLTKGWDNTVFYEFETVRAVRTERWKLVRRLRHGPSELYDVEHDPEELHNLIDRPQCAAIQSRLDQRLATFFSQYADPKYDLAHGGTSKAGFLISDSTPVVGRSARDHAYHLDTANVQLRGQNLHMTDDWRGITGWTDATDVARWSLRGISAGAHRIELDMAAGAGNNRPALLRVDGKPLDVAWSRVARGAGTATWLPATSVRWQTNVSLAKGNRALAVGVPHGAPPGRVTLYCLRITAAADTPT